MRTDFQHLLVKQDGGVLTITMNRPEVLNACDFETYGQLTDIWLEFSADKSLRAAIFTGGVSREGGKSGD